MKSWEVMRVIFPDVLADYFEIVDVTESDTIIDIFMDEREFMEREDYKLGTVRSYGFTEEKVIQDFPIRGKASYLHVRRRKWRDSSTGEIFSYSYDDLTAEGSKLSPEFVAFKKNRIESTAESIKGIANHYGVNGKQLSTQYKEHFSDYRQWNQLSHAEQYLLFPENLGIHLSIDETSLSNGELYTFLTNKEGHGGPGTLVAVVRGTKAEDVIRVLELLDRTKRRQVREVTLDLSPSMMLIVRTVFPKARITNDRFHVQKLYYDALDDMRITYRWMARDLENQEIREARERGEQYKPFRYANGDTRKQLLARAKFILTKHQSKWTESQRWRADIIFEYYPELKRAYDLAMELTDIYNAKSHINAARLKLARWFNKVEKLGTDAFYIVIDTFHNHYETILNFFVNRATNAGAESFNAKVKAFRAQFRGVSDIPFFLFRLMKLCA